MTADMIAFLIGLFGIAAAWHAAQQLKRDEQDALKRKEIQAEIIRRIDELRRQGQVTNIGDDLPKSKPVAYTGETRPLRLDDMCYDRTNQRSN